MTWTVKLCIVLAQFTCAAILLAGCSASGDTPRLFVAASLADLAAAWQEDFRAQGGDMEIHSGASTLLARQIVMGAGADLFLAAGPGPLSIVGEEMRVMRVDSAFLRNRLVIVAAPAVTPPRTLADLANDEYERIAMADPQLAPAGVYARTALEAAGLHELLQPRLVFAANVRATLTAVATGAADVGFVYATDAPSEPALSVTELAEGEAGSTPTYPLLMLAPETPAKVSLWEYLHSERASRLAARFRFQR